MALFYPDILQPNNPSNALVDSDFIRGGGRIVADRTALYALSSKQDQLKEKVTKVWIISEEVELLLQDIANAGNASGWVQNTATVADLQEEINNRIAADQVLQDQITALEIEVVTLTDRVNSTKTKSFVITTTDGESSATIPDLIGKDVYLIIAFGIGSYEVVTITPSDNQIFFNIDTGYFESPTGFSGGTRLGFFYNENTDDMTTITRVVETFAAMEAMFLTERSDIVYEYTVLVDESAGGVLSHYTRYNGVGSYFVEGDLT